MVWLGVRPEFSLRVRHHLVAIATSDGEGGLLTAILASPGKIVGEFPGARPIAISPDGSLLALTNYSPDTGSTVMVVDLAAGRAVTKELPLDGFVAGLGDWVGNALAIPHEGGVHIVRYDTGQELVSEKSVSPSGSGTQFVVSAALLEEGVVELVVDNFDPDRIGADSDGAWSKRVERCEEERCEVLSSRSAVRGEYIAVVALPESVLSAEDAAATRIVELLNARMDTK